ncbi:hypothetical protein [Halioxenophilus aromaticivorans]|uniref:hypothetical protein n=1 Tax=Halioxenophilus aromaticivorans TaxID=1306992 RepID=UPI0031ECADDD
MLEVDNLLYFLLPEFVCAEVPAGKKTIYLIDTAGGQVTIGEVNFTADSSSAEFLVAIDYEGFTDYFLSMKEMKCLESSELWCHLKYPYEQPRRISADDLRWLS